MWCMAAIKNTRAFVAKIKMIISFSTLFMRSSIFCCYNPLNHYFIRSLINPDYYAIYYTCTVNVL